MHHLVIVITFLFIVTWTSALNPSTDLPRFGKPLNNLTISVSREAVFACIVENLGSYKVAWLRVDTQTILTISTHVITKNHRITVNHMGRTWFLHIKDTRVSDRGLYMCQVNTDPMSSITGVLTVVVPPNIVDESTSSDMVVREGSNVTLRCSASGTPDPMITWRREGGDMILLSNSQRVQSIEGPEMRITRVTRLHMGPYLCIASNGVPPTPSKRILLIVQFQPMIWMENQLFSAHEGQSVILKCGSEAYPKPITYWTKASNETVSNDANYKSETLFKDYEATMKLTIKKVRSQDFGTFRCVATNSLGETEGIINLYRSNKPLSTHGPNSRGDPNHIRKSHRGRNTGNGIEDDDSSLTDIENLDEQVDFQSATASRAFHHYFFTNLGNTVVITILAGGLLT